MKKILTSILSLTLVMGMAVGLVGCGDEESTSNSAEIKLGAYKGLTVTESTMVVDDKAVQDYIDYILDAMAETVQLKEGTVASGDTIVADYAGTIDGKEFTNGTKEDASLLMTEGTFGFAGFETGIIGHKVGETVSLDLTVPTDYTDAAIAGKAVNFKVTIDSITTKQIPELTDAFVAEKFTYLDVSTVEDFKKSCAKDVKINNIYTAIWQTVLDNAEVISYDEKALEELTNTYIEYNESVLQNQYGYTLDAYLQVVGQTKDEFEKEMLNTAKDTLKEKMVVRKIAELEGIEVTDEEYQKKMDAYVANSSYKTEEEFLKGYGYTKEDYVYNFLAIEVEEFVCLSVVSVPDETTVEGATTTAASETTTAAQ